MPFRHKAVTRAAAVTLTAAAVLATGGVANAQIPGQNRPMEVFPVDDRRIQLAIGGPSAAGVASGSIQNNTDSDLSCTGVDGSPVGTVTRDTIVARSVDFYAQYPYSPLAPFELDVSAPGMDLDTAFDLGSAVGSAPASLADMLWPDLAAMLPIAQEYDEARLAGQAVTMGDTITIPAREVDTFTVQLPRPSAGERQDFSTGVFVTCTLEDQRYVFHAYENGRPAVIPDPSGDAGRFPGS